MERGQPISFKPWTFKYFGVANKEKIVVGGYWSDSCPQGCAVAMQIRRTTKGLGSGAKIR
jgi:hypothetical protein